MTARLAGQGNQPKVQLVLRIRSSSWESGSKLFSPASGARSHLFAKACLSPGIARSAHLKHATPGSAGHPYSAITPASRVASGAASLHAGCIRSHTVADITRRGYDHSLLYFPCCTSAQLYPPPCYVGRRRIARLSKLPCRLWRACER